MAKTFKQAMRKVREVYEDNSTEYHKNFSVDLTRVLAINTPIDEGYANANWVADIGAPTLKPYKRTELTHTGKVAEMHAKNNMSKLKYGEDVYINNAVQGRKVRGVAEFDGSGYIIQLDKGFSNQAPAGMTGPVLANAKIISTKALNKVFR